MTTYKIIEATADSKLGFRPYGAAADLWMCKNHEIILSGPAETGKTRSALEKLNALLWKYPGAQAVMVRKQYSDMRGSCIQTYEKKVLGDSLGDDGPIVKYGGETPQFYDYPNRSRLWVGGLDKPGKVLSSERDFIYINQAEEITLEDWETLLTRATGRAGNAPYAQVFGDCNPGPRNHWILERANADQLTLLHSRHEDNPTLFNPDTGEITPQGKATMAVLDALSGVRLQRLRYGKWVSAEGQIYNDYDPVLHLIDPLDIPADWRRFRCIDFGLVHPFVCGWWAVDGDGRMYLYRQLYMTGRTVATHAAAIKQHTPPTEKIETTVCDHDAEDRLTLAENGIPNIAAKKDVLQGIGRVQDRLKKQADDKPRLFIFKNSLVEVDQSLKQSRRPYAVEQEFDGYIWADNAKREQPVKTDDHGMDMKRYAVMYVDNQATGNMSDVPQSKTKQSRWNIEHSEKIGRWQL